jgi:hypothetical protein
MFNSSKGVKQLLSEYAMQAYEIELHRELTKLDLSFEDWRIGRITSDEMSYRMHVYEIGPFRKLHQRYNEGDRAKSVAYAISSGILLREQMPEQVLEAIAGPLHSFEGMR